MRWKRERAKRRTVQNRDTWCLFDEIRNAFDTCRCDAVVAEVQFGEAGVRLLVEGLNDGVRCVVCADRGHV